MATRHDIRHHGDDACACTHMKALTLFRRGRGHMAICRDVNSNEGKVSLHHPHHHHHHAVVIVIMMQWSVVYDDVSHAHDAVH